MAEYRLIETIGDNKPLFPVNNDSTPLVTGTASEIMTFLLDNDTDMSAYALKKKPVTYWKTGLTKKASSI